MRNRNQQFVWAVLLWQPLAGIVCIAQVYKFTLRAFCFCNRKSLYKLSFVRYSSLFAFMQARTQCTGEYWSIRAALENLFLKKPVQVRAYGPCLLCLRGDRHFLELSSVQAPSPRLRSHTHTVGTTCCFKIFSIYLVYLQELSEGQMRHFLLWSYKHTVTNIYNIRSIFSVCQY